LMCREARMKANQAPHRAGMKLPLPQASQHFVLANNGVPRSCFLSFSCGFEE
jgi:hypothetical protein